MCAKCEKPFHGNRYYERKGLAYCETHYNEVGGIKENLSIFPKLVSRSFLNRFVDEFDLPLDKNKVTQCASKIVKEPRVWKQD